MPRLGRAGGDAGGDALRLGDGLVVDAIDAEGALLHHPLVLVELARESDAEALLARIDLARVAEYAPYWVVLSHARRRSGDPSSACDAMTKAITHTRRARPGVC
jgi:hypothetical protein